MPIAARHGLAIVEDCLPGAPGHRGGPAGRHASASPAPSASIRPRTSARSATAAPSSPTTRRSPSGCGGCATAARPAAITTTSPASTSRLDEMQAAILRARLPYLAGVDQRRRAALAARYRAAPARRRPCTCRREFDAGHVYHLFVVRTAADRDRAAGAPGDARHRDAGALSGADSAAAGARATRHPADCPVADARVRRASCRCRCIRGFDRRATSERGRRASATFHEE